MNEIFSRFSHFCRVLDPAPCNHRRRRRSSSSVAGSSTIRFQSEKDSSPVSTYTLLVATTTTRELLAYTFSKKHMCSFLFSYLFFFFFASLPCSFARNHGVNRNGQKRPTQKLDLHAAAAVCCTQERRLPDYKNILLTVSSTKPRNSFASCKRDS